jgi:hypothetical protein
MKFQALPETSKVSSAKLGIYCTIFCLVAGIIFGNLKAMSYPANSFGMGLISFAWSLFWCGLTFSLLNINAGSKRAALFLLCIYGVNVLISIFVVNVCSSRECTQPLYGLTGDFDPR